MEIICYACGRGEYPENTLEAIQNCIATNPNWIIEMDIQMTKDRELVIFHDETTDRTTELEANINELNIYQVKKLNAGHHFKVDGVYPYRENPIAIPTLFEVLTRFPDAQLMLDVHSENEEAMYKLINEVERYEASRRVIIVSKYDRQIDIVKSMRPFWPCGAATNEAKNLIYSSFVKLDKFFPLSSDYLMIPVRYGNIKVLTTRITKHVNKRNKKIWAWMHEGRHVKNVDNLEELATMEKLGVDGVFTDYPSQMVSETHIDVSHR